jgi:hypothetical protein
MKKIQNILAAMTLAAVVLFSTTFANAGIIIAGYTGTTKDTSSDPCTVETKDSAKVDNGIIVTDLTGIIIAGFTGIIIAGATGIIVTDATSKDSSTTNCGIIIAG